MHIREDFFQIIENFHNKEKISNVGMKIAWNLQNTPTLKLSASALKQI